MNDAEPVRATNPPAKIKLTPSAIVRFLDQHVIGQDDAKRALAVVVYAHFKKLVAAQNEVRDEARNEQITMGKSNVLLVGPTGTGKTLLCETLSRAISVPFVTADATSLAQTKYVNEEIEAILLRLVEKADGNMQKASRGIVFIDEIDKLKSSVAETRATSGENVQHALLKIMEGSLVKLTGGVTIDTTNILFICGGAFVGLESVIANGKAYGFISLTDAKNQLILDRLNSRVKPTDLIAYGLIPEFTGRLPVVTSLQPLSKEMLVKIMTEPASSLYNQFREILKREGVELQIAARVFDEIASLAVEYKVGARSLRGIFEEMIAPVMFAVPDRTDIKRVEIKSLFEEATLHTA